MSVTIKPAVVSSSTWHADDEVRQYYICHHGWCSILYMRWHFTHFFIINCNLLSIDLVKKSLVLLTRHEDTRLKNDYDCIDCYGVCFPDYDDEADEVFDGRAFKLKVGLWTRRQRPSWMILMITMMKFEDGVVSLILTTLWCILTTKDDERGIIIVMMIMNRPPCNWWWFGAKVIDWGDTWSLVAASSASNSLISSEYSCHLTMIRSYICNRVMSVCHRHWCVKKQAQKAR